jgi:hypothetical protein
MVGFPLTYYLTSVNVFNRVTDEGYAFLEVVL